MTKTELLACCCLFALFLAGPLVRAQEPPGSLMWEVVGDPVDEFDRWPDSNFIAFTDTLTYSLEREGLFALRPEHAGGDGRTWMLLSKPFQTGELHVTSIGALFAVAISNNVVRSLDGGRSWHGYPVPGDGEFMRETETLLELRPAGENSIGDGPGVLVAGTDGLGMARSTDGGDSWTSIGNGTPLFDIHFTRGLAYAPPSPNRETSVVVSIGFAGAAYSTDEGLTWSASNLLQDFGYQGYFAAYSPHDDSLYAVINGIPPDGGSDLGMVWASADGAVWELRGRIPTGGDSGPAQIVAGADGGLWALLPGTIDAKVFSSSDGGRTWVNRGVVDGRPLVGNALRAQRLEVGPEGRLWMATTDAVPGPADGGTGAVLRTVEPVVVGAEDGPDHDPGAGRAALEVWPNPSGGAFKVSLTLAKAADAEVAVYDALGRRVAVLHAEPLGAGERRFRFDGSGLPAGLYVVRAEGNELDLSETVSLVH